jgi:hypothetical protein
MIPQDFPSCHNSSAFGLSKQLLAESRLYFQSDPRHKANRAIFSADEILARHTSYVSLIKESMPDG